MSDGSIEPSSVADFASVSDPEVVEVQDSEAGDQGDAGAVEPAWAGSSEAGQTQVGRGLSVVRSVMYEMACLPGRPRRFDHSPGVSHLMRRSHDRTFRAL